MVIAGKRPLDAQLALTLSEVFDVSPDALLSLQKSYEGSGISVQAQGPIGVS